MDKDWILTCKFSAFAKAYTGLENWDEIVDLMYDEDQLWVCWPEARFATKDDLENFRDEYVDIRVHEDFVSFVELHLTVVGMSMSQEIQCDCTNLKELLNKILTV